MAHSRKLFKPLIDVSGRRVARSVAEAVVIGEEIIATNAITPNVLFRFVLSSILISVLSENVP
ncbi:MAG: hypothetical protein MKZ70_00885 [Opitutales bacterium]|nr:hypothetical protein [Opitutales bacterium]